MTADELKALEYGTVIYLPDGVEVKAWSFAGQVPGRNFYTLLHPPDQDGVISNRRPYYTDGVQLLEAKLTEVEAWQQVETLLQEHVEWVRKKIKSYEHLLGQ
ncbi:hypothetical protein [Spirosoma agri]|uniref:Uncharacterized protein n=1 Tax=Spirosoma agri TaxID=1987381 RepID=A0A6M0IKD5_9BACT|nr:hypothetical protein [Spirosoma agri]NEU68337.1 hypothetical protein [Spirosoma agri]